MPGMLFSCCRRKEKGEGREHDGGRVRWWWKGEAEHEPCLLNGRGARVVHDTKVDIQDEVAVV